MAEDIDLLDKKILYELDQNSRQSLSQIAKKTKISQQVISYRLKLYKEKFDDYFILKSRNQYFSNS